MKRVLKGNEAIARGAYEAGVRFAAAYPGTPSSEILDTIGREYEEIYAEWAPNEKVALEAAIGASIGGARAMACMKHVGVNVAADPLMTLSYTGVRGGIVLVTADDPGLYSSQNEQDNRNYAKFAKIPMLEPSDSQEAKDFVRIGFDLSEGFDTPVMVRSVTRISHSKTVVRLEDRCQAPIPVKVEKNPPKWVMLPLYGRERHKTVEERLAELEAYAADFPENRMELNDPKKGIITAGISYQYVKEIFPHYSCLKLGMVWPLSKTLIQRFCDQVEEVYVVEELDPFLEENLKIMGFPVNGGKRLFPRCGELNPLLVEKGLKGPDFREPAGVEAGTLPPRPPNMCAGCPHRGIFYVLKRKGFFVAGDIGCYTLAALPPLTALDSCICMGASIGQAHGLSKVLGPDDRRRVVAVIGDSTFIHGGITPLIDIAYNRGDATVILLDNHATAMTGFQEHPATGFTIRGEPTERLDFVGLAKSVGIKNIRVTNPWNLEEIERAITEETDSGASSLIINQGPCAMLRREIKEYHPPYAIDQDKCTGCRMCLGLGCPAISWNPVKGDEAAQAEGRKGKGFSSIEKSLCPGCGLCVQVCRFDAIYPTGGEAVCGFETRSRESSEGRTSLEGKHGK
ncbi:MAG: indolepyruvate ferredoxin oxidoreductase subunit alpha [Deltaproteobacteria bacterium]|nr:indolepyruvate ferredoxin oxidoreductase subunit alpha [Deltaproteobacteria bacterium]